MVIHDRNILVVVAQVDSPGYWNVSVHVGSRIDLINTGSGHVFLAFAGEEERALMLAEQGGAEPAILSPQLLTRLARVRQKGYEIMESQQVASVTNLSVPIFGPLGTVIAAVTCPYTVRLGKLDAPDQAASVELLIAAGHEISARTSLNDASLHRPPA